MSAQTNTGMIVPWKPRLDMPIGMIESYDLNVAKWRTLTDAIFPQAKTAGAILLALDYCKARNLDIMKRPVHIVPMWSSEREDYVETVWPGINEVETTAARTNAWAGMDSPVFGPLITRTFVSYFDKWEGPRGQRRKTGTEEKEVTLAYPEWCEITVYRLTQGQRYPYIERVWWEESYARVGKGPFPIPNDTWQRRTKSMLQKCGKAASLRAGFPECAEYVAEEMEGQSIEKLGVDALRGHVIEATAKVVAPSESDSQETDETLWSVAIPTGEVIDAREELTGDQKKTREQVFAELRTNQKAVTLCDKLVERGKETGLWHNCLMLAHQRSNGNQGVLWFLLSALCEAQKEINKVGNA